MNSFMNGIVFLLTTLAYFLTIKPILSTNILESVELYAKYTKDSYLAIAIYLAITIVLQFFINTASISSMCGGNIVENMGTSVMSTFFPWFFIFVPLIVALMLYSNIKNMFSDVVGYFWVSNSASTLLAELLIDKNSANESENVQAVTELVLKIYGNNSLLINQITPSNFADYWTQLKPLIKPTMYESRDMKTKLFDIVVSRDNIGEAMWLMYTGMLVVSLVQLKIASRGCIQSQATMEKNYKQYLEDEKKASEKKELAQSTTYTL